MPIVTLILTAVTRDSIVQVSDRRLTRSDGTLFDDNTTKAILFCGRLAIGYTGSAFIENVPTAEWLARVIAPHQDIEAGFDDAVSKLETFITSQPSPKTWRLAFVATGWGTETRAGRLNPTPFIYTVSNFLGDDGTSLQDATPSWNKRVEWLEPGFSHLLGIAGQHLTKLEKDSIDRAIRNTLKRCAAPYGLAEALGETIRIIACESSERGKCVGRGANSASLV